MNRTILKTLIISFFIAFTAISCKKKNDKIDEIKFYSVGEVYEVGAEKGIIYKVVTISGGMYAMAVSLDEAELAWSLENIKTGATDLENGLKNQQKIQSLPDWATQYPAFKWCYDKNKNGSGGWYLPSPTEMRELFTTEIEDKEENKTIRLNEYLLKMGGVGFSPSDRYGISPYWTSAETVSENVAATPYYYNSGGISTIKSVVQKVRAIKYIRIY